MQERNVEYVGVAVVIQKDMEVIINNMMAKLYTSITQGLNSVKTCTIYREDVPETFETPYFLVTFLNQTTAYGINMRLKNTVKVDISYFPEDQANPNDECWYVGQMLSKKLQLDGFKIKNRSMEIVDKMLHFMFDVDYREYRESESTDMQTLTHNTEIKED